MPETLSWTSVADAPENLEGIRDVERDVPAFLAALTHAARGRLAEEAAATCWLVSEGDLPVAAVRAVPLRCASDPSGAPAGGAGEAMRRIGEADPDTLVVLDVTVAFGARQRGVGSAVLAGLDARRSGLGLDRTLVLLRPHLKAAYPLIPFARYASFVTPDGDPFDPWFRAAWRAGYVPVLGVERSLSGVADLASWQHWLGVDVPGSGPFLVEGAIKPAIIEVERGEGRYREPHLWVGVGEQFGGRRDDWVAALAAAGVVAGDRSHREVKRRRAAGAERDTEA